MKIVPRPVVGYEAIKDKYGVSALCAKVFAANQLSEGQILECLQEKTLADPFSAQGISEVVARLALAKEQNEKVMVCGDYDADGICATTILYDALCRYGLTCGFYIPNRFKEGYGLHPHIVEMAKEKGYQLLITVDNGVKAFDALKRCAELGLEIIVSDHHSMEDETLTCSHLLHPQTLGEQFSTLCGAGVALLLSRALLGEVKEHVVLAAVASIGDVMPLWKETRQIVRLGLDYLKEGVCLPIQYLSKDAYPVWDERMIAFQVVPKLNATGRLADLANANNTVRYLLMKDRTNIIAFAKQMEDLNQKRRLMSSKMSEYARTLVEEDTTFQMLYHESFHEGLVGLAAGKLSEELHVPVCVFAKSQDMLKGSIRSNGIVDLRTFFADCPFELLSYGGHEAAAGIAIKEEQLPQLKAYAQKRMKEVPQKQKEDIKEVIVTSVQELCVDAVEELEQLAPFGEGFPKPIFYVEAYPVEQIKQLSNGKHVKWESLEQVDALYFNAKDVYATYVGESTLSFLGSLSINHFRNEKKVNILVSDVIS